MNSNVIYIIDDVQELFCANKRNVRDEIKIEKL